jgi:hypothetical protein
VQIVNGSVVDAESGVIEVRTKKARHSGSTIAVDRGSSLMARTSDSV